MKRKAKRNRYLTQVLIINTWVNIHINKYILTIDYNLL